MKNSGKKYAPPNDRGLKPWVRETREFRWESASIVYAESAQAARHAFRIGRYESVRVRRATLEDVATLPHESSTQ